jgi:Uma2 family endonuclease
VVLRSILQPDLRFPTEQFALQLLHGYLDNGAQLGWLIDPSERRVYVYRPGVAVERLDNPANISGDPELPGFVLDLISIWEASF